MRKSKFTPFAFILSLRRIKISNFHQSRSSKLQRLSSKEDGQPHFCCASLNEVPLAFFLTGPHLESQHVSKIATAASRKTPLDVIMGGQWNFWRKGEFTFFLQRYLQPLYLSRSSPHTQKSLPFPLRLLLSRFYP